MDMCAATGPTLDDMPCEIVVMIARAMDSALAVMRLALTCRRYLDLLGDGLLWKDYCWAHFGPPLHEGFIAAAKGWHWLYRAQACIAAAKGPDVGAVMMLGRIYWGDTLDGLPHGYGLSLAIPTPHRNGRAPTRRKHDGPLDATAARHDGHWRCGLPHGHGTRVYRNGSHYEGDWCDGLHNGHGERRDSKGWHYVGAWHSGKQHGNGCIVLSNGRRYDGAWIDGIHRYWDTCVAPDGLVYSGWWHMDVVSALGSRNAQWLDSGTLTLPDGTVYTGKYDGNVIRGTATWIDGRRFEGTWHAWKMPMGLDGDGVMTYANGDVHDGGFRWGLRHGRGTTTRAGGLCIECDWVNGNASHEVVITWPDGRRFEGMLGGSPRDGEGQVTYVGISQ
ncbi:Morn repeat protein [Pandoravirus inopinatum]|uniref:Morn repeat protein n=1 Tax=Pandoravirus inopinatum TaxID=1605721 RepID=A0A0B5J2K8_9VIRU|nr:Morn repeat protein [Pandoravirus inopinatum]AJF97794.1 Morn repeat protein [Pandoravirus inopinatum]